MQKNTVELAVGAFFILGLAAFTLLAFKVSGLADSYLAESYELVAEFENIGGLKPRARVSIAGVPIGRVSSIRFNGQKFLAEVTLEISNTVSNLPEDTKASILTSGLLGDNYIGLQPGFSQKFLQPGDQINIENTNKAVVLEDLLAKLFSSQASGLK